MEKRKQSSLLTDFLCTSEKLNCDNQNAGEEEGLLKAVGQLKDKYCLNK